MAAAREVAWRGVLWLGFTSVLWLGCERPPEREPGALASVRQAAYSDVTCGAFGQAPCNPNWAGVWNWCDRGLAPSGGSCQNAPDSAPAEQRRWRPDVTSFTESPSARALGLQRRLGRSQPFNHVAWLGAHNTYNTAQESLGSGLAGWQHSFSITDMLRMGVRSIDMDVHADATSRIQVCHSASRPCPIGSRPLAYALREVRDWLVSNPNELLFINVQREWDDSRTQEVALTFYNELTDEFLSRQELNQLRGNSTLFPSVDRIRAFGRQVLILGGNIPMPGGGWPQGEALSVDWQSSWPWWTDNGQASIKNFWTSYEERQACEWKVLDSGSGWYGSNQPLPAHPTDNRFYSFVGDSSQEPVFWSTSPEHVRRAQECNVGVVLDPIGQSGFGPYRDFQELMKASLWSWDDGQPDNFNDEDCAELRSNGRWNDARCDQQKRFACHKLDSPLDWRLSATAGTWSQNTGRCPSGYVFSVPRNGAQNAALTRALVASGQTTAWLAYNDRLVEGDWRGLVEFWHYTPPNRANALKLEEPGDTHGGMWNDNHLVVPEADAYHWKWSWAGPIQGMRCTLVNEPGDTAGTYSPWDDNYLCVPSNSPVYFTWSYQGPVAGRTCVRFSEADAAWEDNYLCYRDF